MKRAHDLNIFEFKNKVRYNKNMKGRILFVVLFLTFFSAAFSATIKEGMDLYNAGRFEEAEVVFRDIIKVNPNVYSIYRYLVASLFEQKKFAEALIYIKKLENGGVYAKKYIDYETYIKILIEQERLDEAVKKAGEALNVIEEPPVQEKIRDLIVLAHIKAERPHEAVNAIKGFSDWEKNPSHLYNIGEILVNNSEDDTGLRYLSSCYKIALETENLAMQEKVSSFLNKKIADIKNQPVKILFLKKIVSAGIDNPDLKKMLETLMRDNTYRARIAKFNELMASPDLKKITNFVVLKEARELLASMHLEFPERDFSTLDARLKKESTSHMILLAGIGFGFLLVVFIVVLIVKGAAKAAKKLALSKDKKKARIAAAKEEKAARIKKQPEPKKEKKGRPVAIEEPESGQTSETGEAAAEGISPEKPDEIPIVLSESEPLHSDEEGPSGGTPSDSILDDALLHEAERVGALVEDRGPSDEASSSDEALSSHEAHTLESGVPPETATSAVDDVTQKEEIPAEPELVPVPDSSDIPLADPEKDLRREFLTISSEEEKAFIQNNNIGQNIMDSFKMLHFFKKSDLSKVLEILRGADLKVHGDAVRLIVEGIETDVNTFEKAGICYFYYKNTGIADKAEHFKELGIKFKK